MKTTIFICLTLMLIASVSADGGSNQYNLMSHRKLNELCKNWDDKMMQCIECYEGCTKWEQICVHIVKYCKKWDDMGNCIECEQGYGNDSGMSINGTCPENPNATIALPGNETDINCQCHADDKKCISCYAGYYLDMDNFCMDLPENCTAADPSGMCTACVSGFAVQNGTCMPQECDLTLCLQFNADRTKCTSCPMRSYLQDGCCLEVNGYCEQWVEATGVCTKCYVGYKLNKNNNKECVPVGTL